MVYSILFLFAAAFRLPGLSTGSTFHEHTRSSRLGSSLLLLLLPLLSPSESTLQRGEEEGVEAQEGRHPGNTNEEKRRVEATGGDEHVSFSRTVSLLVYVYHIGRLIDTRVGCPTLAK